MENDVATYIAKCEKNIRPRVICTCSFPVVKWCDPYGLSSKLI